ncbi:hypothetical protein QR680_012770 [Steinernema hermaphroditum]|uniref:Uncharacterized protein n=1 Tax=Steinernema hermaphroditum TaxID=289476 RepID=A0AA39I4H6_9BILA|nr:hypothetical protein QR680_012770 [Steinernema hermaphroditum]
MNRIHPTLELWEGLDSPQRSCESTSLQDLSSVYSSHPIPSVAGPGTPQIPTCTPIPPTLRSPPSPRPRPTVYLHRADFYDSDPNMLIGANFHFRDGWSEPRTLGLGSGVAPHTSPANYPDHPHSCPAPDAGNGSQKAAFARLLLWPRRRRRLSQEIVLLTLFLVELELPFELPHLKIHFASSLFLNEHLLLRCHTPNQPEDLLVPPGLPQAEFLAAPLIRFFASPKLPRFIAAPRAPICVEWSQKIDAARVTVGVAPPRRRPNAFGTSTPEGEPRSPLRSAN